MAGCLVGADASGLEALLVVVEAVAVTGRLPEACAAWGGFEFESKAKRRTAFRAHTRAHAPPVRNTAGRAGNRSAWGFGC